VEKWGRQYCVRIGGGIGELRAIISGMIAQIYLKANLGVRDAIHWVKNTM
jgi:hypothetical protein